MIKNIQAKNKLMAKIAPLLLALVVIFTYTRLFITPTIKNLRELRPKVTGLRQNIKSAEENIKNIEAVQRRLNDLKKRIGSYENRLPQKKEIPSLLQYLSEIAAESGVKITSIEPVKEIAPAGSKDYTEIPIALSAKCGYHQLGTFISKLESSPRFMKVSNIKISRNQGDVYHHNVDLKISTFIILENEN